MTRKRRIEVFTAGCAFCHDAVELVRSIACPSCNVEVLNTNERASALKAKAYGVRSLPAVVIDGKLADCCAGRGVDAAALRQAGIGTPLP